MKKKLLGDALLERKPADFKKILKEFEKPSFQALSGRLRRERVNRALLEWIQEQKTPCFLLPDTLSFIQQVIKKEILEHYTFNGFEFWLNQFSHLSAEENYLVRAKIAGKHIERSDYQNLFPIGMGKIYEGTHFVTAHKSPDLDTTVASFWGWLDAFAARVGDGLHVWNLPGGPPPSQIEIEVLFHNYFGEAVFSHLPKTGTALHLTSIDLMTQKRLQRKHLDDSIASIDHEEDKNAIIVIDDEGFYLGDWRSVDVEGVRQVIILLSSCLRWFENHLHLQIISLFARPKLTFKEIAPFLSKLFELSLKECEPAAEFTVKQKKEVNIFVTDVLKIKQGLDASFQELANAFAHFTKIPFHNIDDLTKAMKPLFDSKGNLKENRPIIFDFLERVIRGLHGSILQVRQRLENLDIALQTKDKVFGQTPQFLTVRSELEEIQSKMGVSSTLTVVHADGEKKDPIGVVRASDVRKPILGTVSLRDFCNREEMTIPAYLDVISIIDHHKSQLNTFAPPLAIISDAQSSNTLVARAAFEINDRYKNLSNKSPHFIDPFREYLEYLHFLYAILDDTDLLSKVSVLDIDCVASLLNRLKFLSTDKKTEIISLHNLARDHSYLKKGALKLLQTEDLYSLYRKVYAFREKEVEKNIELCAKGTPSNFFADTKEQNGCCRIGQTKVFAKNISLLHAHSHAIRRIWLEKAKKVQEQNREICLHIHMISTIVGAEEVYRGIEDNHQHQDELWIWAPLEDNGLARLKRFLNAFQRSPGLKDNPLEVEFLGENGRDFGQIFKESFFGIPQKYSKKGLDIAVLRCKAGSLNSRKAMITPFLPNLA